MRKLLISDKPKLTLLPGMWNQARLAEKGKWIDHPELAETLDNYVTDIADMNYSKNGYQGKIKGKFFSVKVTMTTRGKMCKTILPQPLIKTLKRTKKKIKMFL